MVPRFCLWFCSVPRQGGTTRKTYVQKKTRQRFQHITCEQAKLGNSCHANEGEAGWELLSQRGEASILELKAKPVT
jgi:hypothetical protein